MDSYITDSSLTEKEALEQNSSSLCPPEILHQQRMIEVFYYSFDEKLHKGQIVVNKLLVEDVKDAFQLIRDIKFPITSVIPVAGPKFHWDDLLSMKADNTSGFNYRKIYKTDTLSNHSYGRAIDINPFLNPYYTEDGVSPEDAVYDKSKSGTIIANDQIVSFFKSRGWEWGGDWKDFKDYQHFQKLP